MLKVSIENTLTLRFSEVSTPTTGVMLYITCGGIYIPVSIMNEGSIGWKIVDRQGEIDAKNVSGDTLAYLSRSDSAHVICSQTGVYIAEDLDPVKFFDIAWLMFLRGCEYMMMQDQFHVSIIEFGAHRLLAMNSMLIRDDVIRELPAAFKPDLDDMPSEHAIDFPPFTDAQRSTVINYHTQSGLYAQCCSQVVHNACNACWHQAKKVIYQMD